jgi:hypothetical protein
VGGDLSLATAATGTHGRPCPSLNRSNSGRAPPTLMWPSRTFSYLSVAARAQPLAGFEPAGSVAFRQVGDEAAEMTLTLRYTLTEPVEW